jgi:hypothetical protein
MGPLERAMPADAGADAVEVAAPDGHDVEIEELDISTPEYRRVGHAMATLVVKVAQSGSLGPALARAQMSVRTPAASVALDPVLVTHEAPASGREEIRVWFLIDLSQLISADATFALLIGHSELPLRDPQPRAPWSTGEGDVNIGMDSAWSESELRAVVGAIEDRCRVAERSAADLRELVERDLEPGDYTSKLTNAWREVEVLQELLDTRESAYRAVKEVLDAAAAERDVRDTQIKAMQAELERAQREAVNRGDALSDEVERARERAADGRRLAEAVAATLRQVRAERQVLLDQAAQAVTDLERERAARDLQATPPPRRRRGGWLERARLVRP